MFKNKLYKIVSILMCITILMGCDIKNKSNVDTSHQESASEDGRVELNIWSYYALEQELIDSFEKEYPNIKINFKEFKYEEYELEYKNSLMNEEGKADILIIDSTDFGNFNSINGLEDLSKSEYTAMDYKEDFDSDLWELGKSMDKSKLVGLAIASAPTVTYYRKDILEKYGFPGDPYELAEYMKDKENFFNMARTLKANGISVTQWNNELLKIYTSEMPYFNEKFEYQRDNERFREGIEIAKEVKKYGLSAFTDIWTETGKKALSDGEIAMLYLGSWGSRELANMLPNQKGLWRVTSLPFGVYGWNNSSIISMAENSSKKDVAWKFIEYYVFKYQDVNRIGNVAGYLPLRNSEKTLNNESEFLGGQKEQELYENIMAKTKEYPVTPLDNSAFYIWDEQVNIGLDDELSIDEIMTNIRNQIEHDLSEDIEILKEPIKE